MKQTPEGRIKAAVLRRLERLGFLAWNNPNGAVRIAPNRWVHFGKKGSSDIIGLLPGGRFLAEVTESGGMALTVRSLGELDQALRAEGYISESPLFAG